MPIRLGHLRLDVEDLDGAIAFYTGVLGLTVHERATDDASHYAFLTDGAEIPGAPGPMHHRLVLRQALDPAGRALAATTRLDHVAWEVSTAAELLATVERLRASGADVDLQEAGIAWQCYSHSPEGVRLEVYLDRRRADGGRAYWRGIQKDLDEAALRDAAGAPGPAPGSKAV